ncbi:MAG TPA: AAA family ATPase, partial [Buchnera sp. (in: enterobacteria)]|nr:AAA family ATPase [Buchnera sp. (in: enterobacteria)]
SNILFICGGAFSGLEKIISQRIEIGTRIGFNAIIKQKNNLNKKNQLFDKTAPEDLIKFGLIPEFVGRLPILTILHELNQESLIKILCEPKNALTKQYKKLFSLEGVILEFDHESIQAIAKQAMMRKTGARGLRAIIEVILLDVMYEIPSMKNIKKVLINKSVVQNKSVPILIYENDKSIEKCNTLSK